MAFGSLLLEGHSVRLAGEDSRRGTFSQRHCSLVDYETGKPWIPLDDLDGADGRFWVYDSLLSEYAALGFEYGYAQANSDALVLWEAQFGDFINGAQVIIDQYLVAAEDKWNQRNGLVLLLPHGFEGQGPEHSSARIERFLTSAAEDNMQICNATTAAQYFHLLRRQVHTERHTPLILFTPKQGLRMKQTRSPIDELTTGSFQEILDDPFVTDRDAVRRIVFGSGKVIWDAMAERDKREAPAAIVRVEQLYPSPIDQLLKLLETYPNARELVWLQEEPENMGAWAFVESRVWRVKERGYDLRHVARVESGSPATGSKTIHDQELADLMDETFSVCGRRSAWRRRRAEPGRSPLNDAQRRAFSWSARSRARSTSSAIASARVLDLDRRHAHLAGRLEVDAEVVEEDALGRVDAEQVAGGGVERRLRLAHTDLARLDDDVEALHHRGDVGTQVLAVGRGDVVRQARRPQPRCPHTIEGGDHLLAHLTTEQGEDIGPGDLVTERRGLLGEGGIEPGVVELGALQPSPGVGVGIGSVDGADEVGGQPVQLLEVAEGLEWAGQDDAAEVPQHRSDHGR